MKIYSTRQTFDNEFERFMDKPIWVKVGVANNSRYDRYIRILYKTDGGYMVNEMPAMFIQDPPNGLTLENVVAQINAEYLYTYSYFDKLVNKQELLSTEDLVGFALAGREY